MFLVPVCSLHKFCPRVCVLSKQYWISELDLFPPLAFHYIIQQTLFLWQERNFCLVTPHWPRDAVLPIDHLILSPSSPFIYLASNDELVAPANLRACYHLKGEMLDKPSAFPTRLWAEAAPLAAPELLLGRRWKEASKDRGGSSGMRVEMLSTSNRTPEMGPGVQTWIFSQELLKSAVNWKGLGKYAVALSNFPRAVFLPQGARMCGWEVGVWVVVLGGCL